MMCAAVSIVCRIKTVNWKNIYLLLFYSLPYFSQEKREVRVRPFNFFSCFSTLTKLLNGWLVLFILKKKTGLRHNVLLVLSFILCPHLYIFWILSVCVRRCIFDVSATNILFSSVDYLPRQGKLQFQTSITLVKISLLMIL